MWAIKHLVTPPLRWVYRATGGRLVFGRDDASHILLLTTIGRRSGREHTTPVYFLRDQDRLVICNVNPGFEHTNPWVLNLRARPIAKVQVGRETALFRAREVSDAEMERYWPQLLTLWPAYQTHYERSGQRAVFVLERQASQG